MTTFAVGQHVRAKREKRLMGGSLLDDIASRGDVGTVEIAGVSHCFVRWCGEAMWVRTEQLEPAPASPVPDAAALRTALAGVASIMDEYRICVKHYTAKAMPAPTLQAFLFEEADEGWLAPHLIGVLEALDNADTDARTSTAAEEQ